MLSDMSDPKIATEPPHPTMSEWEREIAALIVEALSLDVGPDAFMPDEPLYGGLARAGLPGGRAGVAA